LSGQGQPGTQKNINTSIVEATPIALPPLPEQRKIAAILTAVDDAIAATEAVIEQLQVVKKAMMSELLTRGIPGRHTKFKQTEIGEIPEEWEARTLGSLFHIQLGKMLDAKATATFPQFPYLGNREVQWGKVELGSLRMMNFSEREKEKFSLRQGDLLVCEGGEVGRAALWYGPPGVYFQKALHRLRPSSNEALPEYFVHFLRHAAETGQLADFTSRSSIAHLTREKLALVRCALPAMAEQIQIAKALAAIDESVSHREVEKAQLRDVKSALMSVLLTGEVRVRPAEDGE
jgi:type I restriction enzyme S subunit